MKHSDEGHVNNRNHYGRLLVMTAISFIAMYVLMYAMVDRFANVFVNLNQVYMAGLMAAPTQQFVNLLDAIPRDFVYALNALIEKNESTESAAA